MVWFWFGNLRFIGNPNKFVARMNVLYVDVFFMPLENQQTFGFGVVGLEDCKYRTAFNFDGYIFFGSD